MRFYEPKQKNNVWLLHSGKEYIAIQIYDENEGNATIFLKNEIAKELVKKLQRALKRRGEL